MALKQKSLKRTTKRKSLKRTPKRKTPKRTTKRKSLKRTPKRKSLKRTPKRKTPKRKISKKTGMLNEGYNNLINIPNENNNINSIENNRWASIMTVNDNTETYILKLNVIEIRLIIHRKPNKAELVINVNKKQLEKEKALKNKVSPFFLIDNNFINKQILDILEFAQSRRNYSFFKIPDITTNIEFSSIQRIKNPYIMNVFEHNGSPRHNYIPQIINYLVSIVH